MREAESSLPRYRAVPKLRNCSLTLALHGKRAGAAKRGQTKCREERAVLSVLLGRATAFVSSGTWTWTCTCSCTCSNQLVLSAFLAHVPSDLRAPILLPPVLDSGDKACLP